MGRLIQFKYTIKDRTFCPGEQSVFIDSDAVVVLGERNDWMIYDDRHKGYVKTKAFMVNLKGVEYGSINGGAELFSLGDCRDSCGGIFSPEFEIEFE